MSQVNENNQSISLVEFCNMQSRRIKETQLKTDDRRIKDINQQIKSFIFAEDEDWAKWNH